MKFVDPDGNDIILLNRSWGAAALGECYGHNAVLVGNDDTGWFYFSKDNVSTNTTLKFATLQDFIDYNNSLDTPVEDSYDNAYRIKTSTKEDDRAIKYGKENYNKGYSLWEIKNNKGTVTRQNCADLSSDVISTNERIKISKIKIYDKGIRTPITWPNKQYLLFKMNNPGYEVNIYDENQIEQRKQYQQEKKQQEFDRLMHDAHIY